MEKTKLTAETFDSVMSMLQSPDKESVVLGLTCIEELDLTSGLVYLLLMKKLANVTDDLWKEHAPKKVAFLKSIVSGTSVITYKRIMDILKERKVSTTDLQFFFTKFAEYLVVSLGSDYPGVLSIEINLKFKLHEPETSGQLEQSI